MKRKRINEFRADDISKKTCCGKAFWNDLLRNRSDRNSWLIRFRAFTVSAGILGSDDSGYIGFGWCKFKFIGSLFADSGLLAATRAGFISFGNINNE